ncbi:hypothetical protein JB92DRAFT_3095471 [Gautieria morchelliformis]|nr:hypothetical protein JB92DRAFT_3095471 [Gautieria morchelliformis]
MDDGVGNGATGRGPGDGGSLCRARGHHPSFTENERVTVVMPSTWVTTPDRQGDPTPHGQHVRYVSSWSSCTLGGGGGRCCCGKGSTESKSGNRVGEILDLPWGDLVFRRIRSTVSDAGGGEKSAWSWSMVTSRSLVEDKGF